MLLARHTDNLFLGMYGPLGLRKLSIPLQERTTHMYVIGITGKGKSKFLEHMLFEDIVAGRGCGLLDPHGDLVDDLLHNLASHPRQAAPHWERVVYFDPSDPDTILPFNVLNTPFSAYETTQNIVEAFRRTWPHALEEAPRFANIATASLLTLIANHLTLVDMPRLLTDRSFRADLLANVRDPELLAFWEDRFDQWGREAPLMIESILNKVTAFSLNPHLRQILGTRENRLNLRRIMDERQVLIVNLGRCDTETRRLVGSLIVTGLEQAARARRDTRQGRTPFYFTIDEFQDFCANDGAVQTLSQILSECRKYGLHMTLAHQTLAQVNERMLGALGNIQLKAIFGVARADAEILTRQVFQADSERVKHEVEQPEQQTRSHPLYYSLQEEWESFIQILQDLPPRQTMIKRPGYGRVTRMTTPLIRYASQLAFDAEGTRRWLAKKVGIPSRDPASALTQPGWPSSRNALSAPTWREPIAVTG